MTPLDQLIHFAHDAYAATRGIPTLPHDEVEAVRRASGKSVSDFLDHLARRIAHQYFAGDLRFEVADCAVNSLVAYCLTQYDVSLPAYAHEVYTAFDHGEYLHAGDAVGTDPELKYTKPQIAVIVTRDLSLGAIA